MKIIGKPYSGKLNVRFDEGELEIELAATTPALYFTVIYRTRLPLKLSVKLCSLHESLISL